MKKTACLRCLKSLDTARLVVQFCLDVAENVELCGTSRDPGGGRAGHIIASSITAEQQSCETTALQASAPRVNHLVKKCTRLNRTEGSLDKEAPLD